MHPPSSWTSTYRLTSGSRQQRILQAVQRLDRSDILALGTMRDGEAYVVLECSSAAAGIRSRRIVLAVDPTARLVASTRVRQVSEEASDPLPRRFVRLLPTERLRDLL
jgi:hypothetical protein